MDNIEIKQMNSAERYYSEVKQEMASAYMINSKIKQEKASGGINRTIVKMEKKPYETELGNNYDMNESEIDKYKTTRDISEISGIPGIKQEMDPSEAEHNDIKIEEHLLDYEKDNDHSSGGLVISYEKIKQKLDSESNTHLIDKDMTSFPCKICIQNFKFKSQLLMHQKLYHEKLYNCSHCNKAFASKDNFLMHEGTHTEENSYSCSHCNKAFARKGNLLAHVKIHTGELPYRCSYCSKGFIIKCNLLLHERTHTGKKPYSRSQCNKAFAKKR